MAVTTAGADLAELIDPREPLAIFGGGTRAVVRARRRAQRQLIAASASWGEFIEVTLTEAARQNAVIFGGYGSSAPASALREAQLEPGDDAPRLALRLVPLDDDDFDIL